MTFGITIPLDLPLAEHAGALRGLAEDGYTDFWTSETAATDAFSPLAYAAAVLPQARLGTAIASVFTRGPALLAMNAASVADAAPGRFVLGIGAASPAIVSNWNSVPFERPLARVRDTLRFLRAALAGERVDEKYDTFTVRGFRLERVPAQPPQILLAALRPRMLELAARSADGAILNWLSAADVDQVVPVVHAAGPGRHIAARILVCPSTNTEVVRRAARRLIAGYLTVPTYEAFQRWLGHGDDLGPMWRLWADGDRRGAAASVPDEVVDRLFVHGSPEDCAAHVERYVAAGVTTPILKFLPLDPDCDLLAGAHDVAAAYRRLPGAGGATANTGR